MNYENILNELIALHNEYGFKPYYRNGMIHTGQCTTQQMERLDEAMAWELTSTNGEYRRISTSSTEQISREEFGRMEKDGFRFRIVDGIINMR